MGLLIAQDPESHKLMVLGPIRGSPAERAGIQAGDEVRPSSPTARCPSTQTDALMWRHLVRFRMWVRGMVAAFVSAESALVC